ncbi:hypothetical protein [Rhizobium lusitanum]|uniref:DUF551 domain-containing protein n=1 Tax=Rhizobium lusitanum TaxID=293958 RepID=A0A1C3VT53_9HYPH|nr:hypothetical protein [Rhizobium lusitanum]SCB30757.1 hypothetical protein GA0061101_106153 [Rhizobium lusitanum]
MTTPHDKALAAACEATILGEDENYKPVHLELREAEMAISAYLSSIGGVVCQRNPSAWAHRLNLELDQFLTEFTGEPEHPFGEPGVEFSAEFTVNSTPLHAPLPIAGKGDEWILVPEEMTNELIKAATKDRQVLVFEKGRYYNAWMEFDEYEGGWLWMDEADSEPNPSHYRPLPAPPSRSEEGREKP